jgi:ribosome-associated toxin RatA of RatAB toxin-antitoxin module
MHSTIAIDVDAPPALVFAMASDVTRWERLLPHYARSRAERRHPDGSVTCTFVARRPLVPVLGLGLPVAWRSRVWRDVDQRRLRFRHLGGVTAGMVVTWRLLPRAGDGTRIEIEHDFERGPADLLPRVIEQAFVRPIAGRTLATFKALAEVVHASGDAP